MTLHRPSGLEVLLLLASLAVGALLAEVAARVMSPVAGRNALIEREPVIGWRYRPSSEGWSMMERAVHFRTNRLGFRDVDHETTKPAGTIRIAVIGDSFADALQVDLSETFWKIIEQNAAGCARGQRVEVLNFGMGGFSSAQELLTLRSYALAFAPDIVLLEFFHGNDVADNSPEIDRDVRRPFLVTRGDELVAGTLPDPWGPRALDAHLQLSSRAYWLVRRGITQLRSRRSAPLRRATRASEIGHFDEAFHEPRTPVWERAWTLTDRLVRAIVDEAKEAGARPIVMSATAGFQVSPHPEVRARARRLLGVDTLDYAERRMTRLAAEHRFRFVPIVDVLAAEAEAHGTMFHGESIPDMGHWNAAGHAVAGRELSRVVCEEIRTLPGYHR